jgi:CheY-like chemotaxis protein
MGSLFPTGRRRRLDVGSALPDGQDVEALRKATSENSDARPRSTRLSVVIVDDDPVLVDSLRDLLVEEGYEAEGFTDACAALARIRDGAAPNVLLLDYVMPAMSGEDFIQALSASNIHLNVVVFTAMHESALGPCTAGVAGVIRKPFDLEPLLETIARVARS